MTTEQRKLLDDFEARVRQLMQLCDDLKLENRNLEGEKNGLNESLNALSEENINLQNRYDNLKMAKAISVGEDDFGKAKSRLSKLVREVDKCIALLNE